jgi:hypothetical protein
MRAHHRRRRFGIEQLLVVALAALAAVGGCKSTEEKLIDARTELRTEEDALFAAYGGSDVAVAVAAGAQQVAGSPGGAASDPLTALVGQVIGNGAKEMDREMFGNDCRAVGSGERVPFFTDKARSFFARPETLAGCKRVAVLVATVARLEAELGLAPGGGPTTPGSPTAGPPSVP